MDTSEIYVKMCEKAKEIQAIKPEMMRTWNEIGSWFLDNTGDLVCFDSVGALYKYWSAKGRIAVTWLPRQDQLQEMVELSGYTFYFHESLSKNDPKELVYNGERGIKLWGVQALSMEQLWLAFVMKEKYNKIWNGEDWIAGKNL